MVTASNVAEVVALFGFTELAAEAWCECEGDPPGFPTNPLNNKVPTGDVGKPLPHAGVPASTTAVGFYAGGTFYRYPSATVGLQASYRAVKTLAPVYPGYQRILDQAGSGDAYAQARAVERSPWAGGNYGSTPTADGCLGRYVKAHLPEAPVITKGNGQQQWWTAPSAVVVRSSPLATAPALATLAKGARVYTFGEVYVGTLSWRLVLVPGAVGTVPAVGFVYRYDLTPDPLDPARLAAVEPVLQGAPVNPPVPPETVLATGHYEVK